MKLKSIKHILFSLILASKEASGATSAAIEFVRPQFNPVEALLAISPLGCGLMQYSKDLIYKSMLVKAADRLFALPILALKTAYENKLLIIFIAGLLYTTSLFNRAFKIVKKRVERHPIITKWLARKFIQFAINVTSIKTMTLIDHKVKAYGHKLLCIVIHGLIFPILGSLVQETALHCIS